ncbi:MAG: hypothetical protein QM699_13635 [Amaricoccus sp.]|uniref:hypothetical protein n=1 Tax=Amaricoccus sp. TaxID=1872485 RepID=UPI0039E3B779
MIRPHQPFARLALAAALAFAALPAAADEFTDTVESALKAYTDGDVDGARQDLDYASKLLGSMKAQSLAKFLPEALPGWTRAEPSDGDSADFMGMFGGGTTTEASYSKDGADLTITLVANSPMVSSVAAMISGVAGMATGDKPIRVQRTEFHHDGDELQGVVNNKVMVSVSGSATIEDKTAYLEAMDFKALGDF